VWTSQPVEISADEALEPNRKSRGPSPEALDDAKEFLLSALADGPRPSSEVEDEAKNAQGISKKTYHRARVELGIKPYREQVPGTWIIALPSGPTNVANCSA